MTLPRPGDRPYVLAELGFNHDGDLGRATEWVKSIAEAGADGAQISLYRTRHLLSATYLADEVETFRRHEISRDEYLRLRETAHRHGIDLVASVFDRELWEWYATETDPPFVTVDSGDITFKRLLVMIGERDLPVVLNTGSATEREIQQALDWLDPEPNGLCLCHGGGFEPTPSERLHLRRMVWLRDRFDHPAGLSDCSTSRKSPPVAAALGARIWKRKVTLDPSREGPHHAISMAMDEFSSLIEDLPEAYDRDLEDLPFDPQPLLGESRPEWTTEEKEFQVNTRRSLMADRPLSAGSVLEADMIRELRPGRGLPADKIDQCLGLPIPRPTDPMTMISY